jgi:DNA-binding LacI/PurR family transcriptional regulator
MQKVSIYDLAKLAGVSPMTVSRALREGTLVASTTRKLVQNLARKHGYIPDKAGVALKAGRMVEVAVSFEILRRSEFSSIVGELNLRLAQVGYFMKVLPPRPLPLSLRDIKKNIPKHHPQGLLLNNIASESVVDWLEQEKIPTVWLMERPSVAAGKIIFFGSEDYSGTRLILHYLYGLGHRRIAHLRSQEPTFGALQRERSYLDFMQEHGLPPMLETTTFTPDGGAASASLIMARTPQPTALLCANDMAAAGVLFRLQEMGLRVPADVSVVGFGDVPSAHYDFFYPGLTTVRHAYQQLGLKAVDALVDLMLGRSVKSGDFLIPAEPVIRGTCGPVKSR